MDPESSPLAPAQPATGAWQSLLTVLLERWHHAPTGAPLAARGGGSPANLPAGSLDRLAQRPAELRPAFLAVLRDRLGRFPFEMVDPSWLCEHVPSDRLLRRWCLGAVPPTLRRQLSLTLPPTSGKTEVWVDALGAPPWFAEWWQGMLFAAIPYPQPLPWSRREDEPISLLAGLSAEHLAVLLRHYGLRFIAAAVRAAPREDAVAVVYTLPATLQQPFVELVREQSGCAAGWPEAFAAARAELTDPLAVASRLALLDLAANAPAAGRTDDLIRVAYRLPRVSGEQLLAAVGRHPNLAIEPATWRIALLSDLRELAGRGTITFPNLTEETAA